MEGKFYRGETGVMTTTVRKRQTDGTYVVLPGSEVTELRLTVLVMNAARTKIQDNVSLTPIATYWDANGKLTVPVAAGDTAIISSTEGKETHTFILRATHNGGVGVILGTCVISEPGA